MKIQDLLRHDSIIDKAHKKTSPLFKNIERDNLSPLDIIESKFSNKNIPYYIDDG